MTAAVSPSPRGDAQTAPSSFTLGFEPAKEARLPAGREECVLRLPVRHLGGEACEQIFGATRPLASSHGFTLHEKGELLLGCTTQLIGGDRALAARQLYRRLLAASAGHSLYRIWNYVPAINAEIEALENYRAFCTGRAEAFAEHFGAAFDSVLPAASAVGCHGEALVLAFVAGRAAPRHLENPQQVAAYRYPREHGPHSPSFSRATLGTHGGLPLVFISGTAAIKGHATVAPHRLREQLDCTFDNLRLIGRTAGVGDDLGRSGAWTRHFKIYLRYAADLAEVRARFETSFAQPGDRVSYLEADICRAPLNVEIEATLVGL